MMKRLFPTALAVLLLLLAGCTAKPDTSNQSKPAEYYLTDTDLPLDDAARLRAAPDFLTAEQQTLYRQAFALYSAMFDGETTGIDDAFPAANCQTEYDKYTPDGSDYTYISSHSRWQSWADFDSVIHALFTDTFWSDCNDDGNAPIYIEHDGRLFILDCAYGDQYYNSNIPDEFTLTAQTDNRIDFTVTAHYSYPYPRQDETEAERDDRLETSYEYTRTYPVTLIYTDAGWRFDAFTTPNQADMQLLGEWDGVEETDFYNARISLSAAELPDFPKRKRGNMLRHGKAQIGGDAKCRKVRAHQPRDVGQHGGKGKHHRHPAIVRHVDGVFIVRRDLDDLPQDAPDVPKRHQRQQCAGGGKHPRKIA